MPRIKSSSLKKRPGVGQYLDKKQRIRTSKVPRSGLSNKGFKSFAIGLKNASNKRISLREALFISKSGLVRGDVLFVSRWGAGLGIPKDSEQMRITKRLLEKGFVSEQALYKHFISFVPTDELRRLIGEVKKLY